MNQKTDPRSQGEVEIGEAAAVIRLETGWPQKAIYGLGIAMSVFHICVNTIGVMPGIYRNASHLGLSLDDSKHLFQKGGRHDIPPLSIYMDSKSSLFSHNSRGPFSLV